MVLHVPLLVDMLVLCVQCPTEHADTIGTSRAAVLER